jgi:hypothetical protein
MIVRTHRLALGFMLTAAALLCGAGCVASTEREKQAKEGQQDAIPRPEWRVGDRWVYERTSLSGATVVVTRQVVSATSEGYTVRLLGMKSEVSRQWTLDFHLAQETLGEGTTVRYDPPASYFVWPLKPGATWSQAFQYTDGRNDGRYTNTWTVGETIQPIDTVAGRFYSLRVDRRSGTQRLESYWYNPRVRYFVRLEDYLRGYVEQLVEFRSWGSS